MSNKRRRQTKKKHEVPLTEDMLNELNKASFGHQGSGYGYHQGYAGYDNYGQDPDEFYDMEDVWSNDNKYYGQQKYKVRVLICWPTLEFSVTDFFLYSSVSPILQNEKLLVPERALETIVKNLILINHNCMIHGGRNGEVTMTNTDRVPPELPVQLRL